jgi:hypothetical protein
VFQSCLTIFANPDALGEESGKLAQLLYSMMEHPKLSGGEFFLGYFEDLLLHDESVQGIALWKVQSREPVLKTDRSGVVLTLQVMEAIPTEKLEIAALIYNLDELEGYRVCVLDTVTKKDERSFWRDSFLRLKPIEDNYFNTRHYMGLSSAFITQKAPAAFGVDRTDQIDLLNRSADYFKDNETFEVADFAAKLFTEPEQQEAFKTYRDEYARAYAIPLEDQFDISSQAVRKEQRVFKSVIKLDKNFHIYVHGRRDLIERGFDEGKGKKFYKVYYESEE